MKDGKTNPEHHSALAVIAGLDAKTARLPQEFIGNIGDGECAIDSVTQITPENSLHEIFVFARKQQATDIHICVGNPIVFRKAGRLIAQCEQKLSPEKIQKLIEEILNPQQLSEFTSQGDMEFVYTPKGAGRFRITLMKQRLGWDLAARLIPAGVRPFAESGMPDSCANLTKWAQGLILITGPASCGKTTTMATLVEKINQERANHILTIEDPIEIVYIPQKCQITQREINLHSLSQASSLKAALREDPDIIVVSELRDLESIQLAVSAAETGHLVLGTMNTLNAPQTISRLIDSFPPEEQPVLKNMISESLRGVICQQLVPKKDGSGVVPVFEVLIVNSAIASMIREGKFNQILNSITTGKAAGMVLLDDSLMDYVKKGVIDGTEAYYRATNPNNFAEYLNSASKEKTGDPLAPN